VRVDHPHLISPRDALQAGSDVALFIFDRDND